MKGRNILLPLDKIKLDPSQPRKAFAPEVIKSLARSLVVEGLIHPIEVDKNYVLIVGEYRYRAAKLNNWKEIPATINEKALTPYEKLRRQMAENLHQSGSKAGGESMNPMETSDGWVRLYELKSGTNYTPGEQFLGGGRGVKGVFLEIAEELGMPKTTIWEYLKLQEQPRIIKNALKRGLPRTYVRQADRAPEEIKGRLKEKIAKGKYSRRKDIDRVIEIAKHKPELAVTVMEREGKKQSKSANVILNRAIDLGLGLERNPLSAISPAEKNIVVGQLKRISRQIERYIQGEHIIQAIEAV